MTADFALGLGLGVIIGGALDRILFPVALNLWYRVVRHGGALDRILFRAAALWARVVRHVHDDRE